MTNDEVRTIQDNMDEYDCGELYDKAVALLAEVDLLHKALAEAEARIERLIAQTGGGTAAERMTPGQFSRLRARLVFDAEELPY